MKRVALFWLVLGCAIPACVVTAAPTTRMPTLQVTTLKGASFDLAHERGKWVIVNYWATWCNPCIKEMPDISAFVAGRKDVTAIGLAFEDTDRKDIEAFLAKHPVVYPVAQLDTMHPPKDFGEPLGLPTTYLIAPDGTLAKKFIGPVTVADLARAIAAGDAAG
jgi:thiol-disulfide isomerase/thioredoxin